MMVGASIVPVRTMYVVESNSGNVVVLSAARDIVSVICLLKWVQSTPVDPIA